MQYFPAVFFLLFLLFHIYFFSFPFGFSYTALTSTSCFIFHSMLFFWNRYELPAVAHRMVTAENPRQVDVLGFVQDPRFVPSLAETRLHRMMAPSSSPSTGRTSTTSPVATLDIVGNGVMPRSQPFGASVNSQTGNDSSTTVTTSTTRAAVAASSGTTASVPLQSTSTSRPLGQPEHHQPSEQSFVSNASVSRSTQPLFQESGAVASGGSIGDDESDSCVYFMDGEIVAHRQRHHQHQQHENSDHTSRSTSPYTPASLDRSVSIRPQAQQHLQQPNAHQIPENISMEVTQQPGTLNINPRIQSSGSYPSSEDQIESSTPGFTRIHSSLSRNSCHNTSGLTLEDMSQEIQSSAASGVATGSVSEYVPPPPTELIFGTPHASAVEPSRATTKRTLSSTAQAHGSVASSTDTTGTNPHEEGRYDQTPRITNTHHQENLAREGQNEEKKQKEERSMPVFPFFGFGQSSQLQPRDNNTQSSS